MAITRSQMARQLLAGGGLSLEDAKMMAPKGEFLAYINPKEANMLRSAGGSGIMTAAGIPSFIDYGDVESGLAGGEFGGGSPEDTFGGGDSGFDDTADVNLGLAGGRTAFTQPDNDGGGLNNIINYISDNKKGILQNIIGTALLGPAYPMIGLGLAGIGKLRSNNLIDDTDEGGGIKDKFKDTLDRFKQLGDPNKYLAKVTGPALTQMRTLEKAKEMERFGGKPLTEGEKRALDKLKQMDADPNKIYSLPISTVT